MYGLVNKAMQELVLRNHGEEMWNRIRTKAGLEDEEIIGLKSYPDSLTYDLVRVGAEELGVKPEELLEFFGEHWITHTASNGYENVLNLGGNNLTDFLHNLNVIHMKITHLMPSMVPPSFKVKNESAKRIELLYFSDRPGLQSMVVGILRGLGRRFDLDVKIRNLGVDVDFPTGILFELTW